MNHSLYLKYGNYFNGYFIINHEDFDNFIQKKCNGDEGLAKRKIRYCWLWLIIPMIGIIIVNEQISKKGLDCL